MMIDSENNSEYSVAEYAKVRADFPKPKSMGALPGAQPKFLASLYDGHFYEFWGTPPEIYNRWITFSDIVDKIATKALDSKDSGRSHTNAKKILNQYRMSLLTKKLTSPAEANWVITKVAVRLSWYFVA